MTAIAICAPLVWLGWLILTEWVPMYPLNDLSPGNLRSRATAAAVNYPFPLLICAGIAVHRDWSLLVALALCTLVLLGHLVSWWLPYVGRSTAGQRAVYQREYARTWKLLPTAGRAVVIDVQHMVVGVLTLAMLSSTVAVIMIG